jgi:hypothetical protein
MLIFISHSTGETFEVIAWDLNMNIYVAREYGMGWDCLRCMFHVSKEIFYLEGKSWGEGGRHETWRIKLSGE